MALRTVHVSSVPVVTIFVRHSTNCPRQGDEFYKTCKCPKHLRWSYGGEQFRRASRTRTWSVAEEAKREIEAKFKFADPAKPIETMTVVADSRKTIEQATRLFVSDKRSQGIDSDVLKKYERELDRFDNFMKKKSLFFPHDIALEHLTEFRAGWERLYPSSTTRAKVQERLRSFLRYCYESRLIDRCRSSQLSRWMRFPPFLCLSVNIKSC